MKKFLLFCIFMVGLSAEAHFQLVTTITMVGQPVAGVDYFSFTSSGSANPTNFNFVTTPVVYSSDVVVDTVNGQNGTMTNLERRIVENLNGWQSAAFASASSFTLTAPVDVIITNLVGGAWGTSSTVSNTIVISQNVTANQDTGILISPTNFLSGNFVVTNGGGAAFTVVSNTGSYYGDGSKLTGIVASNTNAIANFSSATVSMLSAIPNATNLVDVAPYVGRAYGGAVNYGPSTGQTQRWEILTNHTSRIRASPGGNVAGASFFMGPTNGMTGFYLDVWRRNALGNYDLWGSSSNFWPLAANASQTKLCVISNVVEGDFVGSHITWAAGGATTQNLFATNSLAGFAITNNAPLGTNQPWSTNVLLTTMMPVEPLFLAPNVIGIGDSITAGETTFSGYADTVNAFGTDGNPPTSMFNTLMRSMNLTGQNMGISGDTLQTIGGGRVNTDGTAYSPKIIIVAAGINDIPGQTTNAILGFATNCINRITNAGIIPVLCLMNPAYGSSDVNTLALLTNWMTINQGFQAMTNAYPTLIVVDSTSFLGQYVPFGPVGNLGQLRSEYDPGDHIHLTSLGQSRWAQGIMNALAPDNVFGHVTAGVVHVSSDITFNGASDRTISILRQSGYQGSGSNLLIRAGGAYPNGTNLNGGNLKLSGGIPTGTGTSSVQVVTYPAGSSGASDNSGVTNVTITPAGVSIPYGNLFDLGTAAIGTNSIYSGTTLDVEKNGASTDYTSSIGIFGSDANHHVWLGLNSNVGTNGIGLVGVVKDGIAHIPLALDPDNGGVIIGTTNLAWLYPFGAGLVIPSTLAFNGLVVSNGVQVRTSGLTIGMTTTPAYGAFDARKNANAPDWNNDIANFSIDSTNNIWFGFDRNIEAGLMGSVISGVAHVPTVIDVHNAGVEIGGTNFVNNGSMSGGWQLVVGGSTLINNSLTVSNSINLGSGSFSGNGSGLTNIPFAGLPSYVMTNGGPISPSGITNSGGDYLGVTITNGNYTILQTANVVREVATTNTTINLPWAPQSGSPGGKRLTIINAGTASATLQPGSSNTIGFLTSLVLPTNTAASLFCAPGVTNWDILALGTNSFVISGGGGSSSQTFTTNTWQSQTNFANYRYTTNINSGSIFQSITNQMGYGQVTNNLNIAGSVYLGQLFPTNSFRKTHPWSIKMNGGGATLSAQGLPFGPITAGTLAVNTDTNYSGVQYIHVSASTSSYVTSPYSISFSTGTRNFNHHLDLIGRVTTNNYTTTWIGFWGASSVNASNTLAATVALQATTNGGNWNLVTYAQGAQNTTTSTTAIDTTAFHVYSLAINDLSSNVVAYIDGTPIATNSANIPKNGQPFYAGMDSFSINASTCTFDFLEMEGEFTP
jgi:lysophospholipase L1-like esterase